MAAPPARQWTWRSLVQHPEVRHAPGQVKVLHRLVGGKSARELAHRNVRKSLIGAFLEAVEQLLALGRIHCGDPMYAQGVEFLVAGTAGQRVAAPGGQEIGRASCRDRV